MNDNIWYEYFIETLYKKFPKKTKLTKALTQLLVLEREAVYRRLRQEVYFSAHEIVKIATAWNISLDEISHVNSEQYSFQMKQINYIEPSKKEVEFLRTVIRGLYALQNAADTEFMNICNKLPRQILAGFEYLNQFYLFKERYQYYSCDKTVIPFSKTIISKEKKIITEEYNRAIKCVPQSNFIFDKLLFEYFIKDIQYFHSIRLITDEEKELLKQDLHNLLDYLLEIANHGCYPETQNKVNIYISELNIDTNFSYSFSPDSKVCFVHAFEKLEIFTYNSEMVNKFKAWMQIKKKTSNQISEVDERSRVEFFIRQRQIIDSL